MKWLILLSLTAGLAVSSPALARSLNGVELSSADAGRVQAQCDALRARLASPASDNNSEPPDGEEPNDPASRYATTAGEIDAILSSVNLDRLTLRSCDANGFW